MDSYCGQPLELKQLGISTPVQACYKGSDNWSFTMLINFVTDEQDKIGCEMLVWWYKPEVSLQENSWFIFCHYWQREKLASIFCWSSLWWLQTFFNLLLLRDSLNGWPQCRNSNNVYNLSLKLRWGQCTGNDHEQVSLVLFVQSTKGRVVDGWCTMLGINEDEVVACLQMNVKEWEHCCCLDLGRGYCSLCCSPHCFLVLLQKYTLHHL